MHIEMALKCYTYITVKAAFSGKIVTLIMTVL